MPLCLCGEKSVHPHARGDNHRPGSRGGRVTGSPPRAWGQFTPLPRGERLPRFTPTRVGTIPRLRRDADRNTVHPHARGDNFTVTFSPGCNGGSPPRAWGQSWPPDSQCHRVRFTPTRVGTICLDDSTIRHRPVHPHARGDNCPPTPITAEIFGSPPRAWGQSGKGKALGRHQRFTPTRVGTINWALARRNPHSVHPHARGDNINTLFVDRDMSGSPPRAWGQ